MTNEEAIRVLKSTSVNLGRRGGRTAYAEALEQPTQPNTLKSLDCIDRQAAIDAIEEMQFPIMRLEYVNEQFVFKGMSEALQAIKDLPSVQPEPLSDAYMKAVWTWLLDYQIKMAELKGRYTPYEVLSWVANDWRKEHGG